MPTRVIDVLLWQKKKTSWLPCNWLPLNQRTRDYGRRQRNISSKGSMEKPRPRNSLIKLPSTLSVASYGAHWAYTKGLPQSNAASRVPRKKMKIIFRETPIFGKMPTFSENFRPFLRTQAPTWPWSPVPPNLNQSNKELRELVKVGMFSQSECLLKNTH